MSRPLSQLVSTIAREGLGSPRILTLHDYNQRSGDVQSYAEAATGDDARIVMLESYKGVYLGRVVTGYTWFVGPNDRPSPLFFGDALAEIERFLWDEIDRQAPGDAELPFLIGVGQGAILALAAAAAVPDLLSGVIAVNGRLPVVPGWEPPLASLDGLPILILDDPARPDVNDVLSGERLVETLTGWGGKVRFVPHAGVGIPAAAMSGWMREHVPRMHCSGD